MTICKAGAGLRRKMWLCSIEDPGDAMIDGNATFADASENEKVLCIAVLNPLGKH